MISIYQPSIIALLETKMTSTRTSQKSLVSRIRFSLVLFVVLVTLSLCVNIIPLPLMTYSLSLMLLIVLSRLVPLPLTRFSVKMLVIILILRDNYGTILWPLLTSLTPLVVIVGWWLVILMIYLGILINLEGIE